MAAASSLQLPLIHNLNRRNSPVQDSDSPENRQDDETGVEGPSLRVLADLEPEEIERRLEKTRRELSNRRKILMKNLPQDISNQEVHDILKEYELKYCYVDRNKGTAFVTLLNGEQAQDAIRIFHQTNLRGRELSVQLQPTDSLLCITNLPHTYTLQQFEELVRMYGNIERCFLACSEVTGHSKGYGFVEYMKKDSASKARSELLGRQLGDRTVMVQWTDVNQLTADSLHSKCLCVDKLPSDFSDSEELEEMFSKISKPVFCQVPFVTLLNGEQAQDAIRIFHQTNLRGRELSVQLQPTDSLLCITNLPHTYTLQQFEELVRMYGNIERCFLACSEVTGHSKGYGFVEYMKKDSASKARSELLGRQLGDRTVMVQWTDVNQLTADSLHSKCLCVDKLPSDFSDSEELEEMFSKISKPVFCQLAQDEGSPVGGFAVLEYETAEQAEEVLREMDRQAIGGSEVRVSFCAPGTAGRSTLAALIAAQGVATAAAAYGDYNSYMQAVSQYYSQTHMAQAALQSGYQQRAANKEADMAKAVLGTSLQCASNGSVRSTPQSTAMPAYNSVSLMSGYVVGQPTAASSVTPLQTGRAGLDWGQYYYDALHESLKSKE
ncbi:UNVERIFIED_CONTAM: hypothetical protein FKN15_075175 [Acipenser sinensis]